MSASVVASQTSGGSAGGIWRSTARIPAARAAPTLREQISITVTPVSRARRTVWSVHASADDDKAHRGGDALGGLLQRGQAVRQQRFLVMRGHDDSDRPDHASPVAWATDIGFPSVRM